MIQRVFRAAIRDRIDDRETILLHGPCICGLMLTWLGWFMIIKGMGSIAWVQWFRQSYIDPYMPILVFLVAWGASTLGVHLILAFLGPSASRNLFPAMALVGMVCLAFAFGQNDLANCASPGLSAFWLWQHRAESVATATKIPIPIWVLFVAGALMVAGMFTQNAQRVTRAQVNTGSQFDRVALYAPEWCRRLARWFLRIFPPRKELAPPPTVTPAGKKLHYDTLRAAVITSVSAGIIALASSHGLPVSTTYVSFAAVLATGMADRVLQRGDADLKVGRAIWVVFSWFASAGIAVAATAAVARLIYHWELIGLGVALSANLTVRVLAQRAADRQEERIHLRMSRHSPPAGGFSPQHRTPRAPPRRSGSALPTALNMLRHPAASPLPRTPAIEEMTRTAPSDAKPPVHQLPPVPWGASGGETPPNRGTFTQKAVRSLSPTLEPISYN